MQQEGRQYPVADAEIENIMNLCHKVFGGSSPIASQLLSALKKYYIDNLPVCPPNIPKGMGYYREGQNEIIRTLERFAKQYPEYMANKQRAENIDGSV